MRLIYAKFTLWLLGPALDLRDERKRPAGVTLLQPQRYTTRAQQREVTEDIRGRMAKKPELHR